MPPHSFKTMCFFSQTGYNLIGAGLFYYQKRRTKIWLPL